MLFRLFWNIYFTMFTFVIRLQSGLSELTWKALSEQGYWVNGSSDGMGENLSANIDLLTSNEWIKLTHLNAPKNKIRESVATYELIKLPIKNNIANKKYFYWMSSSAFNLAIAREAKVLEGNHSCGPGNTFKEIKKMIKDPTKLTITLSYDDWKKDILDDQ